MEFDLFEDSNVIRAAYITKFDSVLFDNDTNNPHNNTFVKHGVPKSIKGVDRSYIAGSELVYDNSQTIIYCTPDEIFPEVICDCSDELGTWDVPYVRGNSPDQIKRAVIVSLSFINKNKYLY